MFRNFCTRRNSLSAFHCLLCKSHIVVMPTNEIAQNKDDNDEKRHEKQEDKHNNQQCKDNCSDALCPRDSFYKPGRFVEIVFLYMIT